MAIILLLLANACAQHPTRIQGTGEAVSPPNGWTEYCHRHTEDVDCVKWYGKQPAQ
jgi:predicted transglutaminase-like cysteine proteinase